MTTPISWHCHNCFRILYTLLILTCVILGTFFHPADAYAKNDGFPVSKLLNSVRDTLILVKQKTGGELKLKEAKLTLKTVATIESDGTVKLFVLKLGANVSQTQVHTIKLSLEPPKGDTIPASAKKNTLVDAIVETYKAADEAQRRNPPLRLKELSATTRFVLKAGGGGGLATDFTVIPVSVDLSGAVNNENTQELSLRFGY